VSLFLFHQVHRLPGIMALTTYVIKIVLLGAAAVSVLAGTALADSDHAFRHLGTAHDILQSERDSAVEAMQPTACNRYSSPVPGVHRACLGSSAFPHDNRRKRGTRNVQR